MFDSYKSGVDTFRDVNKGFRLKNVIHFMKNRTEKSLLFSCKHNFSCFFYVVEADSRFVHSSFGDNRNQLSTTVTIQDK